MGFTKYTETKYSKMSNSLAKDKISKITLNNRRRLYFLGYTIVILLIVAISYRYSQKTPKKILEAYENTHSINHRADAISQLLQKSKLLIYQYLANTDSKKIPAFIFTGVDPWELPGMFQVEFNPFPESFDPFQEMPL